MQNTVTEARWRGINFTFTEQNPMKFTCIFIVNIHLCCIDYLQFTELLDSLKIITGRE